MAADIARWHHECYDGSGYPDGLRGAAIPLAARIVQVADVFDALTSQRVYKPKCDPLMALDHIACVDAARFDPLVVAAMVQVFDEFTAVCETHDTKPASPPRGATGAQAAAGSLSWSKPTKS
jgi:putative two-component system response regulator